MSRVIAGNKKAAPDVGRRLHLQPVQIVLDKAKLDSEKNPCFHYEYSMTHVYRFFNRANADSMTYVAVYNIVIGRK